ncbi:protein quaking-B isoform X2 [Denticeps clupeoides]|uniref:protein quaking-B isoform X2 n=1 Tax=Denticeps clupeoides TaxID=299321 RepID=UPI0010A4E322|nr:protein quaking-B isoform X2 [Denticeps clupeoides]
MVGEMEAKEKPKPSPDYLMQLMNDKKLMSSLPNFCGIFNHLERLLDEEIGRVRKDMYNDTLNGSSAEKRSSELPDAVGPVAQLQEKLYVPVKEFPDFNFVGRILGPRGLTAKQLEAETGCKIMVRGKGSMRDKKKEEQNRGKPNWEHLNEDLHVLITVEDSQNRAEIKLRRAVEEVKKLLVPAAEGEDSLKKMQLMELAILNGTYRDANIKSPLAFSLAASAQAPRIITGPAPVMPAAALRTPAPAGPTLMPLIRQIQTSALMPAGTPHPATLVPQAPESGIIYAPYEYPYALAPATSILEYPIDSTGVLGAVATKVRRQDMRIHPYQRVVTTDRGQFSSSVDEFSTSCVCVCVLCSVCPQSTCGASCDVCRHAPSFIKPLYDHSIDRFIPATKTQLYEWPCVAAAGSPYLGLCGRGYNVHINVC